MEWAKRKKDLSTNANHETGMDTFLGKLGLVRKPTAKDGSCLFRAVAEQVFNCQAEHLRVRKECIDFMKANKERFEAFVEGPFDHYLYNLKSQKQWAGQVEINALSLMYKHDVVVYQAVDAPPINATENKYDNKIFLCYSNGNHYDSIYPLEHRRNLAFCQSIAFDLLYGKVFPKLEAIEYAAKKHMDLSENVEKQNDSDFSKQVLVNGYGSENDEGDEEGWTRVKSRKQVKVSVKHQGRPPVDSHVDNSSTKPVPDSVNNSKFHWEIMRSLDPEGYRNIELEVWEETKREQQQKDQSVAASIQYKKGDLCQVRHPVDDQFYTAVINEVYGKACKVFIRELRESKVVPFSSLKPSENHSNSNYRDLSGYHRKSESYGDSASRGNDDQKSGRRRRSNRNRKSNGNDNFERNPPEAQDDQSGKPRGEKNRRRRNGNPKGRDERKEPRNQGEISPQDNGYFEMSENTSTAFPALPGNASPPEVVKPKTDTVVTNSSPATFWSKLHSPTAATDVENEAQSEQTGDNNVCDSSHEIPQVVPETVPVDTVEVDYDDTGHPNSGCSDTQSIYLLGVCNDVTETREVKLNTMVEDMENVNMTDDTVELYPETEVLSGANDRPETEEVVDNITCSLEEDVVEQSQLEVNGVLYTPESPVKVMQNPARQALEEDPTSHNTEYSKIEYQELVEPVLNQESLLVENNSGAEGIEVVEPSTIPNGYPDPSLDHTQMAAAPPRTMPDQNHQAVSLVDIHNDVLNGKIAYSRDPEGHDLPKDIEILRHFYNLGIQSYMYGINAVYSGGQPVSPVYPVMSPTPPMYTMHQPYQNHSMLLQQNMCQYPQMQVNSQEETQHQSPSEELRDNSPGYKPNMSAHHAAAAQYHQQHHMTPAMMNYAASQMYAQRHLYQNYNMFPSPRANFPRYNAQNKHNFNRQANKKNRYYRNDNQKGVELCNVQSGYGSESTKTIE